MVALTTHDTKRGEDVRARIGVLSQVPSLWAELVGKWALAAPAARRRPRDCSCWQNIFGVWPVDGTISHELRERLHAYAEKAIREAALHTTWNDPNDEFEAAVHTWLDAVLDGPVGTEMTSLVARLDLHARSDALGQKLIALTAPGVPDVYQGTELWEDSLVDPDNRRPVDYATRAKALEALRHPKIRVVAAALRLRRDRAGELHRRRLHAGTGRRPGRRPSGGFPARRRRADRGEPAHRAAVRNRLGRHHVGAAGRPVDRPHLAARGSAAGSWPSSCSRTCRWRCWSAPMAEFAVWAPHPRAGPARRRRHAARR